MPVVNIKKYSRSNIPTDSLNDSVDNNYQIQDEPTGILKKGRGRPKKVIQEQHQEINQQVSIIEEISETPITNNEPEFTEDLVLEPESEPFLEELNTNNYVEPPSEQEKKAQEKSVKESMKQTKKKHNEIEKINSIYESNDLFDDSGTEIIGRDRRVIINKLNQYRNLFPKELAKFKVKKGSTVQELKAYLDEAQTIVETSSYDNFLTDSILQSIKLVEGGSKYTRYDISGCSDLLKANPQFNALMKQLFVKYNVFSKIPVEFQLMMVVTTTAYICVNKNKNKAQLEQYLETPLN